MSGTAGSIITPGLDILSKLLEAPSGGLSKPARELVRNLTGFSQRTAAPGAKTKRPKKTKQKKRGKNGKKGGKGRPSTDAAEAGGVVMSVANAPVAFSRGAIRPFLKTLRTDTDGVLQHVVDLVGIVTTGAASTFTLGSGVMQQQVIPANASAFPNFAAEFTGWQKFRPKMITMHFVHFAPTASQCAVTMGFSTDAARTNPVSTSEMMSLTDAVMGACYEDFALTVDPETYKVADWLYNDSTVATGSDVRFNAAGQYYVATDVNVPVSTGLGYMFIEAVFEFTERKKAAALVGMMALADQSLKAIPESRRAEYMEYVLSKIRREMQLSQVKVPPKTLDFDQFKNQLDAISEFPLEQIAPATPALTRR